MDTTRTFYVFFIRQFRWHFLVIFPFQIENMKIVVPTDDLSCIKLAALVPEPVSYLDYQNPSIYFSITGISVTKQKHLLQL